MKNIIILQNSNISFNLDIKKIYKPNKYKLFIIINNFGFKILSQNQDAKFLAGVKITEDFSFNNIKTLLQSFIKDAKDFNIVTNSEETLPVCGKLRVYFNLDIYDYERFYNKHTMKLILNDNKKIKFPNYIIFEPELFRKNKKTYLEKVLENLKFPLFAKPTQMYGSMNLKKINNANELLAWANLINLNDCYELDEFIEGTMFHCDSFIKDHKILFSFVSKNSRPCYEFIIGKTKGTMVLPENHPDNNLISNFNSEVLKTLGLPKGGVTHLEIIKTYKNELFFIEIAHRSPGILIPKMYDVHANIDTITSQFLLQIDPEYYPKPQITTYAAWACFPKIPGIIKTLKQIPREFKSTGTIDWIANVGDKINSYSKFGRDFLGTLFLKNRNFEILEKEFEIANNLDFFEIN